MVDNFQDSILLFKFEPEAYFQKDAVIHINRNYTNREGYYRYLEDVGKQIDFYKDDSVRLNEALETYRYLKNDSMDIIKGATGGVYIGAGRIIQVYDSIGQARLIKCVPWDIPRAGDHISLSN